MLKKKLKILNIEFITFEKEKSVIINTGKFYRFNNERIRRIKVKLIKSINKSVNNEKLF